MFAAPQQSKMRRFASILSSSRQPSRLSPTALQILHRMPLSSSPVPRRRLHLRRIVIEAFARDDGLIDLEARLIDVKDGDCPLLSGIRPAGESMHDMWIRVAIDMDFVIREAAAATDAMPYAPHCAAITPQYRALEGLCLMRGFRAAVLERFGDVRGCTHLTELLLCLPTAAVQTVAGLRLEVDPDGSRPFQLDRCHALDSRGGGAARQWYPRWYEGPAEATPKGPEENAVPARVTSPAD